MERTTHGSTPNGWLGRLFEGPASPDSEEFLVIGVVCDGLAIVERQDGPEAAEHIRRIMLRLLREAGGESVTVTNEGDEFTLIAPEGAIDPNLWAIRMEVLFRQAIFDAGYALCVEFKLDDAPDETIPSEGFYLN